MTEEFMAATTTQLITVEEFSKLPIDTALCIMNFDTEKLSH